MNTDSTTYVGLDVHKRTVAVAMLLPGEGQPVEWQEVNDARVARRLARRLLRQAQGKVVCIAWASSCSGVTASTT